MSLANMALEMNNLHRNAMRACELTGSGRHQTLLLAGDELLPPRPLQAPRCQSCFLPAAAVWLQGPRQSFSHVLPASLHTLQGLGIELTKALSLLCLLIVLETGQVKARKSRWSVRLSHDKLAATDASQA